MPESQANQQFQSAFSQHQQQQQQQQKFTPRPTQPGVNAKPAPGVRPNTGSFNAQGGATAFTDGHPGGDAGEQPKSWQGQKRSWDDTNKNFTANQFQQNNFNNGSASNPQGYNHNNASAFNNKRGRTALMSEAPIAPLADVMDQWTTEQSSMFEHPQSWDNPGQGKAAGRDEWGGGGRGGRGGRGRGGFGRTHYGRDNSWEDPVRELGVPDGDSAVSGWDRRADGSKDRRDRSDREWDDDRDRGRDNRDRDRDRDRDRNRDRDRDRDNRDKDKDRDRDRDMDGDSGRKDNRRDNDSDDTKHWDEADKRDGGARPKPQISGWDKA